MLVHTQTLAMETPLKPDVSGARYGWCCGCESLMVIDGVFIGASDDKRLALFETFMAS